MWIIAPLLGIPGFLMPELQATLTLSASIAFALGFIGFRIALVFCTISSSS
jgi:hypothetical protein